MTWFGVLGLGVQLLRRTVKRFRGGLVFKAHRLVYHSTLCLRVIKKKKKGWGSGVQGFRVENRGLKVGGRVPGSGSRVQGPGSRVQGPGFRVQGPGSKVQGSGFRAQAVGCRL